MASRLTKVLSEITKVKGNTSPKDSINESTTVTTQKQLLIEYDAGYVLNEAVDVIRDHIEDRKDLKESTDINMSDEVTLKCILQKTDTKNRNGRIYPKSILSREAQRYSKLIENNNAYGELDHPESKAVALANTSHYVTKMWWKDNELHGEIKLLLSPGFIKRGIVSTPADKAANIIINGGRIGISSRGLGSLKTENGKKIVQDDFELLCFDIVASPSTYDAYLFNKDDEIVRYDSKRGLGESTSSSKNSHDKFSVILENFINRRSKH